MNNVNWKKIWYTPLWVDLSNLFMGAFCQFSRLNYSEFFLKLPPKCYSLFAKIVRFKGVCILFIFMLFGDQPYSPFPVSQISATASPFLRVFWTKFLSFKSMHLLHLSVKWSPSNWQVQSKSIQVGQLTWRDSKWKYPEGHCMLTPQFFFLRGYFCTLPQGISWPYLFVQIDRKRIVAMRHQFFCIFFKLV